MQTSFAFDETPIDPVRLTSEESPFIWKGELTKEEALMLTHALDEEKAARSSYALANEKLSAARISLVNAIKEKMIVYRRVLHKHHINDIKSVKLSGMDIYVEKYDSKEEM